MLRIARFVLLAAALVVPTGCVSGGATSSDRLDKLEAQMKTTQTYDLRIAHLEDRLTLLEQDLGRARAGSPSPRVVEPTPTPVAPMSAKPVSTVPVNARPVSAVPMTTMPVSAAPEAAPLSLISSMEKTPASGKPATASEAASASSLGPVQAALADLTGSAAPAASSSNAGPVSEYQAGGRRVAPETAMSVPAPAESKKAGTPGAGPHASYDAALALFESKKYNDAKAAFEAFIAANPGHSLRPNAQYWAGECQYSQGNYSGAILNFTDVAGNYPTHPKAAAALLKAGYAYANLGDQENARFYWQMLRHDFPKSSEARLAAKRMGTDQ